MDPSTSSTKQIDSGFALFKPSWAAVKLNLITFLEIILIPIIFSLIGATIHVGAAKSVFAFLGDIVGLLLTPAIIVTQLHSAQNKTIDLTKAISEGLHYFWRVIGIYICIFVVVIIGLILLIVPGLFMIRRYILSPFYLVDQDLGIFEAMKKSADNSKQFSPAIWSMIMVSAVFALLVLVFVGIFLTFAYYCASAILYLRIKALIGTKATPRQAVINSDKKLA